MYFLSYFVAGRSMYAVCRKILFAALLTEYIVAYWHR